MTINEQCELPIMKMLEERITTKEGLVKYYTSCGMNNFVDKNEFLINDIKEILPYVQEQEEASIARAKEDSTTAERARIIATLMEMISGWPESYVGFEIIQEAIERVSETSISNNP